MQGMSAPLSLQFCQHLLFSVFLLCLLRDDVLSGFPFAFLSWLVTLTYEVILFLWRWRMKSWWDTHWPRPACARFLHEGNPCMSPTWKQAWTRPQDPDKNSSSSSSFLGSSVSPSSLSVNSQLCYNHPPKDMADGTFWDLDSNLGWSDWGIANSSTFMSNFLYFLDSS